MVFSKHFMTVYKEKMLITYLRFDYMTTRKGMKYILFGTAIFLLAAMNVTANETDEDLQEIRTTSVDEGNDHLIAPNPLNHNASEGERGDIEIEEDLEYEQLVIAPNPNEGNLISPGTDTNIESFILDAGNQMNSDAEIKSTSPPFNFPLVLILVSVGLISCIYIHARRQE